MPIVRDGTYPSTPRGLDKEVVQLTASTTINQSHSGRVLQCNSGSTITLTLPSTLPPGFYFEAEQLGAGSVVFAAGTNATLHNRSSYDRTAGQYARARCEVSTRTTSTNAVWNLSGEITDSNGATTATQAELTLLSGDVGSVSWAVTAGAANVCVMTGTIKDASGTTIAASRPLILYISGASTGIGLSGTSYSTGASITTGTAVLTLSSNKSWLINTATDGTFAISITATGKPATEYAVAMVSTTGKLSVSAASSTHFG